MRLSRLQFERLSLRLAALAVAGLMLLYAAGAFAAPAGARLPPPSLWERAAGELILFGWLPAACLIAAVFSAVNFWRAGGEA